MCSCSLKLASTSMLQSISHICDCVRTSTPEKRLAPQSWFMIDWNHFDFSCFSSQNQIAIHWKLPRFGSRGRRCDPQVFACWWSPRIQRCRKLCLVLKQWVSQEGNFIDFSLLLHRRRDFHFIFYFLLFLCAFPYLSRSARLMKRFTMLTDKKVINNEHFVQSGSELTINNAVKHLSGYYSCVIEFLNSGAKLETPHELINIAGEYDVPLACVHISESQLHPSHNVFP